MASVFALLSTTIRVLTWLHHKKVDVTGNSRVVAVVGRINTKNAIIAKSGSVLRVGTRYRHKSGGVGF